MRCGENETSWWSTMTRGLEEMSVLRFTGRAQAKDSTRLRLPSSGLAFEISCPALFCPVGQASAVLAVGAAVVRHCSSPWL